VSSGVWRIYAESRRSTCFRTVSHGKARIRTIVIATHTRDQLDRAIKILVRVGRRMNILQPE
jgi:7-keto-8-aminopelargonate synthetase-like enzyme